MHKNHFSSMFYSRSLSDEQHVPYFSEFFVFFFWCLLRRPSKRFFFEKFHLHGVRREKRAIIITSFTASHFCSHHSHARKKNLNISLTHQIHRNHVHRTIASSARTAASNQTRGYKVVVVGGRRYRSAHSLFTTHNKLVNVATCIFGRHRCGDLSHCDAKAKVTGHGPDDIAER